MARREQAVEESEEPSRAAGACVLVVLAGVATAAVFAVSPAAGVLSAWVIGAFALWRSARRVSDSSATPPPPSLGDVFAAQSGEIARVQEGPGEGMWILYPAPGEEVSEP